MTGREWKPGDVAMVNDCTNPDAPWQPATCQASAVKGECEAVWVLHKSGARVWGSVSQARPLVVIDPEDREQVERLMNAVLAQINDRVLSAGVEKAQAALRDFANQKPVEPTGLGAVVEAADSALWVRLDGPSLGEDWFCGERNTRCTYSSIDAVRVLSEGVTA